MTTAHKTPAKTARSTGTAKISGTARAPVRTAVRTPSNPSDRRPPAARPAASAAKRPNRPPSRVAQALATARLLWQAPGAVRGVVSEAAAMGEAVRESVREALRGQSARSGAELATQALVGTSAGTSPGPSWRRLLMPLICTLALAVALLDFALIIGAVPVPIPGLRVAGQSAVSDTATYGFENDTDGWAARGAAAAPFVTDTHVFAGRTALGVQMAGVSASKQAFVYVAQPDGATTGAHVLVRLYAPSAAPPLIASVYILDGTWTWSNGQFITLKPGQWTAVTYQIPAQARAPIHELGMMIVGSQGDAPYSGPLYLDSVQIQNG
jgi:hypothetical protein